MASCQAFELSVLVPCLNEEHNLRELAARVMHVFSRGRIRGEIVLVDDGSTDGTAAVITELEKQHPGVVVGVRHQHNAGMAEAWRSAARIASGAWIATIDADLQYSPEDLLRLREALRRRGVDIVQGYRSSRARDHRYYLSRGLNHLLNAMFSMDLEDNKSGFVMCSRAVFLDLLSYRGDYFYWQSFVMVAAHAKGYSLAQVEVLFEPRRRGRSFLEGKTVTAVARSLADVGHAALEYRVAPHRHDGDPTRRARWAAYMAAFDRTHWTIRRTAERRLMSLERTQWLDSGALRDLQDDKLRRIVRHAYDHVPYYRARMKAARLRPEDIRGRADLHKLPLLSKDEVRQNLRLGLISDNHDKSEVLHVTTSGSTGEPLVVYADRAQLELRWAATLRAQEWTGYRFGDPSVRLWHQTLGLTRRQAACERAEALLANRTFVPVFDLTERNLETLARTIERVRPVLIDGYAEALDFYAQRLGRGGVRATPKAVMTSAQTLPRASRRTIEDAFGCAVFDKYGSREFSGIAYECDAHAGHHVVAEAYLVEVLREGRPAAPGEVGEVVVTDLTNECMPLLRYRIGDLAEAMDPNDTCRCGRAAPRIGAVEGRVQSIIQGADGRFLPGTFFAHYLKEFEHAIRRFQVVQRERGAIDLRLVRGGRFSPAVLDEILATFRVYLGSDLEVRVEYVEDVPMGPTGKIVSTVTHLDVDFQRAAPLRAVASGW